MENPTINETKPKKDKIKHFILGLLILSVAFNAFFLMKISANEGISGATFFLINPSKGKLIDANVQKEEFIVHYEGLRASIEEEIKKYTETENVGVFVQDIQTGAWTGINERAGLRPASLLKIPIMMAILNKVDHKTIDLQNIVDIKEIDVDNSYSSGKEKKTGDAFTIAELLEEMIIYSDNTAKNALKRQLTIEEVNTVFTHVGIPNPYLPDNDHTVSPRNYIRLFRALYHSTFLSPELSQMALDMTTDTVVENLLSEGVPSNVEVAHKFGVNEGESVESLILHDCGIVYHEKNPYYICVMTKNIEIEEAKKLITHLSRLTYEFIDENKFND